MKECRLANHLQSLHFEPNSQQVAVGVQPHPDGEGVFVVLKIERCIDIAQAAWIANKVGIDLHALLGTDPDEQIVQRHCYREPAGSGWTAAVGVELAERADAEIVAEVVSAYADPGLDGAVN